MRKLEVVLGHDRRRACTSNVDIGWTKKEDSKYLSEFIANVVMERRTGTRRDGRQGHLHKVPSNETSSDQLKRMRCEVKFIYD